MDDIYYKTFCSVSESSQTKELPVQERSYELKKRKTIGVDQQQLDDISLSFFQRALLIQSIRTSTAICHQRRLMSRYFIIDTGLEVQDMEFNRGRLCWIYGLGVVQTEIDASNPINERFGTRVSQKVAGNSFGVTKKSKLVIVKTLSNAASFLHAALSKIILELDSMKSKGGQLNPGANLKKQFFEEELHPLIIRLANDFQAVIVISAGFNSEDTFADIDTYRALLSRTNDIITVGSVIASIGPNNGARYSWSPGGDVLTVSAPGSRACMGFGWGYLVVEALENRISTGIVSGLVAYFLSLPDLASRLRRKSKTPEAVIDYLRSTYVI